MIEFEPDFWRRSSFGDAGWADHTVPDVQAHLRVHAALLHGVATMAEAPELLPKSDIVESQLATSLEGGEALLHGPEQIADLPVPVAESPGAVRIGHPERSHLVEYLAPNSVFNSLPRQRSSPHLRPDDRLVTIDRVLHHASLGVA